jgi:hypothetical protein
LPAGDALAVTVAVAVAAGRRVAAAGRLRRFVTAVSPPLDR